MITALSISDFVLIDHLSLEASPGFTGLTGETGAGKSILLDALGIALGMRPAKRFVRSGAQKAQIAVEFDVLPEHPVWATLAEADLKVGPDETLILKRVIPVQGGARSFVNDHPVPSALLTRLGEMLVEVHGQHAASNLMKPSYHRDFLDAFAGNGKLMSRYQLAWEGVREMRLAYAALSARAADADEAHTFLLHKVTELEALAPERGETDKLTADRAQRMQASRIVESVASALKDLDGANVEAVLASIASTLDRLTRLPGFEADVEGDLPDALRLAADSFERTNIEMLEATGCLQRLANLSASDDAALEEIEARLFALKGAARKYQTTPDDLPDMLKAAQADLALVEDGAAELAEAKKRMVEASARWRSAAEALTCARQAAARRLERAVQKELKPLKLGHARIQIAITPLGDEAADAKGADKVEIEVETNPGAGFGPLRQIASGGELARFSLALKCAAAEAGSVAPTLIFDEADQGVGGAVAAAIGERLQRLAEARQVFAVTHSPQVAAAADTGWRIEKALTGKSGKGLGQTRARVLDAKSRLEEIARMLSGAEVTPEARAAAERLLEG